MKVAQINMLPRGSTGKMMLQIARVARKSGIEARSYVTPIFLVSGKEPQVKEHDLYYFGSFYENMFHNYVGKMLGRNGHYSYFGTRQLVRQLKEFDPDVIHLHNIHAHCINLPLLFRFLRRSNVKVIWTLHDCWTFTGGCYHFDMVGCNKWKTGCHNCEQVRRYTMDTSKQMYNKKKRWFTSVKNMTLVTPSHWLAAQVRESFLKDYPLRVIHNGIDLSVFKPTEGEFRKKYGLEEKKIILGVSFGWSNKKGLDVFIELSKRLPENYQIVLVGTDDATDRILPSNIVSIHRTHDQLELAEIYTAADLFLNPTREEVLGLVNIEANACGTPVLTFRTGGSPEGIDASSGTIVERDNIDALEREIIRICTEVPYSSENCVTRAMQFDMNDRFKEYVKLYEVIGLNEK